MRIVSRKTVLGCSAAIAALALATGAYAQQRTFNVPAQEAVRAIPEFARQADIQIIAPSTELRGVRTPAVRGDLDTREALRLLLQGTGLEIASDDGRVISLRRADGPQAQGAATGPDEATQVAEIVVTGSRIRGAPSSSPVIRLTQEDMRNAGQTDLGQVARSLPQSFGGGQNPGIALGARGGDANNNLNGSSTLNLRGLGPDSTLTLLNGHRLSFDGAFQGVDIAAIPLEAVERLEIVSDGASAIYGSDAVGGVANVILRRDYDGVSVTARLGAATEGGGEQRQYSAVAGRTWRNGGIIGTVDFQRDSDIAASDRGYARSLHPTSTLLPSQKRHAVTVNAHHAISPTVEVRLDALYSRREMEQFAPYTTTDDYQFYGTAMTPDSDSWAVSPAIDIALPGGWRSTAYLVYGEGRTHYETTFYVGNAFSSLTAGCYCNALTSVEINAEGGVFRLPGGTGRLAIGGGYRTNSMDFSREVTSAGSTTSRSFSVDRESYYAFGELYLPILARLSATAALRYEDYPDVDRVATPKIGLIFSPTSEVDLKLSWGESFKAPTLYQQYNSQFIYLFDVTGYGTGYPSGSTILYRDGGNTALTSERAETWTATLSYQPHWAEGLTVDLSYFDITFRDRVANPILSASNILNNPVYADLLVFNPSPEQQADAIDAALTGLQNYSSGAYNPANVVAIVDQRYINIARQNLQGIDLFARHTSQFGGNRITLSAGASYLESEQQLSPGQPIVALAGTVFNPPHFRGRAGATLERGDVVFAAQVSHIGGVTDDRATPRADVSSQTLVDLTARYRPTSGALTGLEFALSVLNVFNDEPDNVWTPADYYTPYDSTNYSAVGRFVGFSITKRW